MPKRQLEVAPQLEKCLSSCSIAPNKHSPEQQEWLLVL